MCARVFEHLRLSLGLTKKFTQYKNLPLIDKECEIKFHSKYITFFEDYFRKHPRCSYTIVPPYILDISDRSKTCDFPSG